MSKKGGFTKFALGVGLGIGAGMLLAPKKGEELRKDLKNKLNELMEKAKEIDVKEVSEEFVAKIKDLKEEIENLDKEKVLSIAKEKGELLKNKANDLVLLAKEKGTPVVEKTANEIRNKAINVTKDVLKKLENKNNDKEDKKTA
ncbi:MAG: YtxH domain-containing protein [Bacilli bacterium]|nr:YtxH domain-containing protein [Bacilli bacterium]